MKPYVGMSVTPKARENFRQLVLTLSSRVGRRVEMSDALAAVTYVASNHMDELVDTIRLMDEITSEET